MLFRSQMDNHIPADQVSSPPLPSGTPRPSLETRVERPSCRRLAVAAEQKRTKYQPVVDALHAQYGSRGWSIEVLPWVVGTRGTLDTHGIQYALNFIGVPDEKRLGLLRKSAVASVEGLQYMHRVRQIGRAHV